MCSAKLVKCTQVVLSVYEVNVVRAWCAVCSVQPGCLCRVQVIVCGQHSLFSKGACAVCRHLRCVFLSSSSRLPTLLQPHSALLLDTTTRTVFGSKGSQMISINRCQLPDLMPHTRRLQDKQIVHPLTTFQSVNKVLCFGFT